MLPNLPAATDDNFQALVIESEQPVLVDFWAPWCGHCRRLAPTIDQFATEHPGVKVVTLNTDEQQRVAAELGILSLPTLIRFENGAEAARVVGAYPKAMLERQLGLAAA